VTVLAAALALPAGAAVAAPSAPVEVTAVQRGLDGRLEFVTEHAPSRTRGHELAREMRSRSRVLAAEVATPVRAFADDPLRPQQWGLTRLRAEATWQQGPAAGVLVAVVDTGVDAGHPDLAGVTAPGVDLIDGGDGRVDPHGHGTHVAGVVAAAAGNGVGGAGLAQGARIMPVRALSADGGGYGSDVAKGITWAVDHGARVVNLSLGGDRPSALVTTAIQYALGRGVVVVAAAGNAGGGGDPVLYPAATAGVVAVGAADAEGRRPSWSSSGSHLAVAAPGVGILSTTPGGGYAAWDGTSMAAPFVSASAALLLADEPGLNPAGVRARLMATATDLEAPGHDSLTGAGLVDVVAARGGARWTAPAPAADPAPVATAPAATVLTAPAEPLPSTPVVPEPVVSVPAVSEPVVAAPVVPVPVVSVPVVSVPVVTAPAAPEVVTTPAPAGPAPAPAVPAVAEPSAALPPAPLPPAPLQAAPATEPVADPRTDAPPAPPSVSVFPAAVSAGQRVTVTYRGAPGAVVDVLSRTQPATTFSRIATITLDGTGTASTTHAPQKSTRLAARSASGELSASQPVIAVRSVASLAVQRVGTRTYSFTGRVYPARDQRLVSLYRNGVLVAQGRSDAAGVYRIGRTLAAGTYGFQVRTSDDQHNLGTASPLRRALIS
jgi:hypothetical protein